MRIDSPFESLHNALSRACQKDLPDIHYVNRDWIKWRAMSQEEKDEAVRTKTEPVTHEIRRPYNDEVEVTMFPQVWGSTALGYGGIGGAAMTPAYTVIVSYHNHYAVYFGQGVLAYMIDLGSISNEGRDKFLDDMRTHSMMDCRTAKVRYV